MNTIYTNRYYCVRRYGASRRRSLFWNKAADFLLCAASTFGVITALFFLLTL
jgi:hypothetical protein